MWKGPTRGDSRTGGRTGAGGAGTLLRVTDPRSARSGPEREENKVLGQLVATPGGAGRMRNAECGRGRRGSDSRTGGRTGAWGRDVAAGHRPALRSLRSRRSGAQPSPPPIFPGGSGGNQGLGTSLELGTWFFELSSPVPIAVSVRPQTRCTPFTCGLGGGMDVGRMRFA